MATGMLLSAALLVGPTASAQTETAATLSVTPSAVAAGEPITLSGTCPPESTVSLGGTGHASVGGNTFLMAAEVRPQPDGSFSLTFPIPEEASSGPFEFSSVCGSEVGGPVNVQVTGSGTPIEWTASPDPVSVGSDLQFTGTGCTVNGAPLEAASVGVNLVAGATANRLLLGSASPDGNGAWHVEMTIPSDYPSGDATAVVSCYDPDVGATPAWQRSTPERTVRIVREPQPAVVRGDRWFLRTSRTSGPADVEFQYGSPGDIPLFGDWYGNGGRTPAVVRDGWWYERYSNTSGYADNWFQYGDPGDIPISGDWNGDGIDTPGVVRNGIWYLRNENREGYADVVFQYGDPGDVPIVGDWDGDGIDTPGVVRDSQWLVRNENSSGSATAVISGCGDQRPVPAAWGGDGRSTCGSAVDGRWVIDDAAHPSFVFGDPGDLAFAWQ